LSSITQAQPSAIHHAIEGHCERRARRVDVGRPERRIERDHVRRTGVFAAAGSALRRRRHRELRRRRFAAATCKYDSEQRQQRGARQSPKTGVESEHGGILLRLSLASPTRWRGWGNFRSAGDIHAIALWTSSRTPQCGRRPATSRSPPRSPTASRDPRHAPKADARAFVLPLRAKVREAAFRRSRTTGRKPAIQWGRSRASPAVRLKNIAPPTASQGTALALREAVKQRTSTNELGKEERRHEPICEKDSRETPASVRCSLSQHSCLIGPGVAARRSAPDDGPIPNNAGGWESPGAGSCFGRRRQPADRPDCVALRIVAANSGACTTALGSWTTGGVCNDLINTTQSACQAAPDRKWNAGTGVCSVVMNGRRPATTSSVLCTGHLGHQRHLRRRLGHAGSRYWLRTGPVDGQRRRRPVPALPQRPHAVQRPARPRHAGRPSTRVTRTCRAR